jgi:D-glycero-D-manno-heptose 1,7-bisphosphate phosphatase
VRTAVFLDRDGTLNVRPPEHEYVTSLPQFQWISGAREGLGRLASAGYALVVVSNQRGVARGLVSPALLARIERRIQDDLAEEGCRVDAFRHCPHDADAGCSCRKPAPGLILGAAADLEVALDGSWMVGDAETDVEAGRAAGCKTVRLGSPGTPTSADLVAPSLLAASEVLVSGLGRAQTLEPAKLSALDGIPPAPGG